MKVENINTNILKQIEKRYPDLWNNAKQKYPRLIDWENGKNYPTYNQLVELSKIFYIPFGDFFLNELPDQKLPITHYRTFNDQGKFIPSFELRDSIFFAQKIQEWAKDILIELGHEPLPFCGKYNIQNGINEIISALRSLLGERNEWANQKTWADVFKYLKNKAENSVIIVLINGVVDNNTHRKLNVNEFRGFVLYDKIAPVIFINNNDAISAKIFTLIYEIVHILIGKSASFDLKNLYSANNKIEKFCDQCTAEFLVPKDQLKNLYSQQKDIEQLAKHFKVSQIVILRRLLDIGEIDKNEFFKKYNIFYEMERKKPQTKVADFYAITQNRLSKSFLSLLQSAINYQIIQFTDALRITKLNTKTLEKLIEIRTFG